LINVKKEERYEWMEAFEFGGFVSQFHGYFWASLGAASFAQCHGGIAAILGVEDQRASLSC
jgi:hypothetical protein